MIALPQYIDVDLWLGFVEMRKAMGKRVPFTDYAQKLILKELMQMHQDGFDANSALRQSIMRGWRGVFRAEMRTVQKQDVDPVLQKIAEDSKKSAPCPPEIKAKLDALRRGVSA